MGRGIRRQEPCLSPSRRQGGHPPIPTRPSLHTTHCHRGLLHQRIPSLEGHPIACQRVEAAPGPSPVAGAREVLAREVPDDKPL